MNCCHFGRRTFTSTLHLLVVMIFIFIGTLTHPHLPSVNITLNAMFFFLNVFVFDEAALTWLSEVWVSSHIMLVLVKRIVLPQASGETAADAQE